MTLDELLAECNKGVAAEAEAAPGPAVDPFARPWWVVVVNPRRTPRRPKFVASFDSEADAVAECGRRTAAEAERVADVREYDPGHQPYTFHAVERPEGGRP